MRAWPWACRDRKDIARDEKVSTIHRAFTKLASDLALRQELIEYGSRSNEASIMTAKPSRLPARRILLAEDDDSMRGFLERALVKAGYEVVAFANGADAYERLKEEPFSLLLTDIVMPRMDGIELARKAGEIDPELKIMFITGFAAVTLNTDAAAPKDAKVLSKPFHLKDLVNEVDTLFAS
jgi:two-component system cell cycle response regulator CpdR